MKKGMTMIILLCFLFVVLAGCGKSGINDINENGTDYSAIESQNEDDTQIEETAPKSSDVEGSASNDVVNASFKSLMDEYEKFFNEYVEFMKKYKNASPTEMASMIKDYSDYMTKYTEYYSKLGSVDTSELSVADLAYYNEVNTRILNKLAEIV